MVKSPSKKQFRARRPARDPGYPEIMVGRREVLGRLGLLAGGALSSVVLIRCGVDVAGGMSYTGVSVTPRSATVAVGAAASFKAGFDDESGYEVVTSIATWVAEDPAIATVDARGQATGVAAGTTKIRAEYSGYRDAATLTVRGPKVVKLEVSPASPTVQVAGQLQLEARAHHADGSRVDVTDRVEWSCVDKAIAVVSGAAKGQITGVAPGATIVSASLETAEGVKVCSTTLTVTA